MREDPQVHTERMEKQYAEYIENSVKNTIWVVPDTAKVTGQQKTIRYSQLMQNFSRVNHNCGVTECHLMAGGTTDALYSYYSNFGYSMQERAVLLNFASSTNPGGGYIGGAMAQEEALCGESNLYNIIKRFDNVYEYQRENTNNSLYADSLLYTPCVVFEDSVRKTSYLADVITCAAPNRRAAIRHENISVVDIERTMYNRIDLVLAAAATLSSCNCIILGAFGCGVFGNDVEFVASAFNNLLLSKYSCLFKTQIYAVPDKTSANYKAFDRMI